jgi:hypothetical protein
MERCGALQSHGPSMPHRREHKRGEQRCASAAPERMRYRCGSWLAHVELCLTPLAVEFDIDCKEHIVCVVCNSTAIQRST